MRAGIVGKLTSQLSQIYPRNYVTILVTGDEREKSPCIIPNIWIGVRNIEGQVVTTFDGCSGKLATRAFVPDGLNPGGGALREQNDQTFLSIAISSSTSASGKVLKWSQ